VHGVANLYVAGSSVFPTSGYANPTFTIVALALRLADHLKTRRLS
jgi:choline dehydrogenase-like flavoprotein